MSSFLLQPTNDDDTWDAELYRNTCSFVPELGESLIGWLEPRTNERILDVGCGTGELTTKLCGQNRDVVGLDASPDMIREARKTNPQPTYVNASIVDSSVREPFDALISNAALHWITRPDRALETIHDHLRDNGRFVAEMGASGNVQTVRKALHEEITRLGYEPDRLDPWYFPEPEEYLGKLEANGFTVTRSRAFDRPTELYGQEGLQVWLIMFAEEFFAPLDKAERQAVIRSLVERLKDELFEDGQWVLGYRRLRFRAVK